jgi:hypothetical protein
VALLHTGKILAFGGSGDDKTHLNNPYPEIFEPDSYTAALLDAADGRVYEASNQNIEGDIFCTGHAFSPDGRLLIAGGTQKYEGSIFGFKILFGD